MCEFKVYKYSGCMHMYSVDTLLHVNVYHSVCCHLTSQYMYKLHLPKFFFVSVENENHCDFVKLREMLVR